MKETPVSNVEKTFILEAVSNGKRTDGRHLEERRNVEIHFGNEYGSCVASLGQTRVSAQVSCSVMEPRATRPNEGMVFIYVEFPPMCSQRFINKAYGGADEEVTEVTRLLERCLKESKAIDTESLCIVSEEKVWGIRLDIRVLNHEGNVADCASIAGLAALAHFRRPDVTLEGDIVTVHPATEKDPVKLAVHHYPVCSTYAFFSNPANPDEKIIVRDPSHIEESVMEGKLVLGINPYKEICTLHLAGRMLTDTKIVLKLAHAACEQAKVIVELIKNALHRDETARKSGQEIGLLHSMKRESILNNERQPQNLDIDKLTEDIGEVPMVQARLDDPPEKPVVVKNKGNGVVELQEDEDEEEDKMDVVAVQQVSAEEKRKGKVLAEIELQSGSDSEEEATKTLSGKDLQQQTGKDGVRGWYKPTWK